MQGVVLKSDSWVKIIFLGVMLQTGTSACLQAGLNSQYVHHSKLFGVARKFMLYDLYIWSRFNLFLCTYN